MNNFSVFGSSINTYDYLFLFMLVYEIFAFLTKSIKSIVGIYRPVSKVLRALDNFFFFFLMKSLYIPQLEHLEKYKIVQNLINF